MFDGQFNWGGCLLYYNGGFQVNILNKQNILVYLFYAENKIGK